MAYLKPALFLSLFFLFSGLNAQELCNNGIDDDGDLLIDCYDPDCGCVAPCDTNYYQDCVTDCPIDLPSFTVDMTLFWEFVGTDTGFNDYNVPIVADIDGDGVQEIIGKRWKYPASADAYPDLVVVDAVTGKMEAFIETAGMRFLYDAPAIADMDGDGYPEIVIFCSEHAENNEYIRMKGSILDTSDVSRKLICYEYDGIGEYKEIWVSDVVASYSDPQDSWTPNIADFNQDGIAEVYIGNFIFNGITGEFMGNGGAGNDYGSLNTGDRGYVSAYSVAADVLPDAHCTDCEGLELIAGANVYSVDIDVSAGTATITVVHKADSSVGDGYTALADIDGDGDLDAIVASNYGSGTADLYVWDLQTSDLLYARYSFSSFRGEIGLPNIDDFDGDGLPEISISAYHQFRVLEPDGGVLKLMWSKSLSERSGQTSAVTFDFDGDGKLEMVYRDEEYVYIWNAATGALVDRMDCVSRTRTENPVIADIDNDGAAEILCSCGTGLKAYKSSGKPWMPTRPFWNQHNYFSVHINDDLTVPIQQQQHHIVGDSVILNRYLAQITVLEFPEKNAIVDVLSRICSNDSVEIEFEVCNDGDSILPAGTPVTIYDGNPTVISAAVLITISLPKDLAKDSCTTMKTKVRDAVAGKFHIVVNDSGTIPRPYTVATAFPATSIIECYYIDNFDSTFLTSSVGAVGDTVCDGDIAYIMAWGGVAYQWSPSTGLSSDTVAAPFLTPTAPTTYMVTITDSFGCEQTIPVEVGVNSNALLEVMNRECKGDSIMIDFEVCNDAGYDLPAGTPITIYDGNPLVTAAPILKTIYTTAPLEKDSCIDIEVVVSKAGTNKYHLVVNEDGSTARPFGLGSTFPAAVTEECEYADNLDSTELIIDFGALGDTVCLGDTAFLNAWGGIDYEWMPSTGLSSDTIADPFVVVSGSMSFMVTITDSMGCTETITVGVDLSSVDSISAGPDKTIVKGGSTELEGSGTGVTYSWSPGYGLSDSTILNPIASPDSTTTYILTIVDANGCVDYDTMVVEVLIANIDVPNAFSPNDDGINDEFYPVYYGEYTGVEFKIFNRWGQLIYESSEFGKGWDGTYKGEDQEMGVYVYLWEGIAPNGDVIGFAGNFTLLR